MTSLTGWAVPTLDARPVLNVPLLRKVMEHIEAHPDEWDQTTWREVRDCGTAMCFAGWAGDLAGGEWVGEDELTWEPEDGGRGLESVLPSDRAARLLGLTDSQAARLFFPHNSLDALRSLVALFTAEAER